MKQFSSLESSAASIPEPTAPAAISDELRRQLNQYKQAMPLSRLIGNGMEYTDALALHALVDRGIPWADAAEWLGERNLLRAQFAQERGHILTVQSFYRYASACFRFGQVSLSGDTERKKSMYRKLIETFASAGALDEPPIEKIEVPYRDGLLCGWLLLPAKGEIPPPVVIILGGFDGWREEYHSGAQYLLERGIAALLVDAPGQGETRLFHHLYLTADVASAFSAFVDALLRDQRLSDRIGIWGNSFGGLLAAHATSADPRIKACCVNGSPAQIREKIEHVPPLFAIAGALVGTMERDAVLSIMDQLSLTQEKNRIHCPLLQLLGGLDPICSLEDARPIYDNAPTNDKQTIIWPDGNHCVYNHSHEKHCSVADWFSDRL